LEPGTGLLYIADMREVEDAGIGGFETIHQLVGTGVDKGDAGADGTGCGLVEIGEVAQLGSGGGESIAHGGHADNHKMHKTVAADGDKTAVEGEGVVVVDVAHQELLGERFVRIDNGGFETVVRLLLKGVEEKGGSGGTEHEIALGQLVALGAELTHLLPTTDIERVVSGLIVLAKNEDVGGGVDLTGAERVGTDAAAPIERDRRLNAEGLEAGAEQLEQRRAVGIGQNDHGEHFESIVSGNGPEQGQEFTAAAQNEDMLFEAIAGKAVTTTNDGAAAEEFGQLPQEVLPDTNHVGLKLKLLV
jgi:hypothetical protein